MSEARVTPRRHRFLTYSLVALAAVMAAYFYFFYGYSYLFPPSLKAGPGCSPIAATFLGANGKGQRIRMEETDCVRDWSTVALYLEGANVSRPFLVLRAGKPVIHATWTSPDSASLDIAGDDVSIDYARDSFGGVRMDYTLHEIPARD